MHEQLRPDLIRYRGVGDFFQHYLEFGWDKDEPAAPRRTSAAVPC